MTPSKDTKILQFNKHQKFNKAPFIFYADLECLIEKADGWKNNAEKLYTRKAVEHIPKLPKEIPIVLHNQSNYSYHFNIKELPEEFEGQFTCLGENTEKYIAFTVSIQKHLIKIDKEGKEITKAISYTLQFTYSARFITSPLSNLVNNLAEGIHKIKCKYGRDDKKCETCGIKYKDCEHCLEYSNLRDDLVEYKYL